MFQPELSCPDRRLDGAAPAAARPTHRDFRGLQPNARVGRHFPATLPGLVCGNGYKKTRSFVINRHGPSLNTLRELIFGEAHMRKFAIVAASMLVLVSNPVTAQETGDTVKSIVDQLVPKDADNSPKGGAQPVLTLQAVTTDEIVNRLGFSPSRSLENLPKAAKLPFVKGRESELLEALRGLPSMQVAVAFQGASDALAPEAGALLSDSGSGSGGRQTR